MFFEWMDLSVVPMVTEAGMQRIELRVHSSRAQHLVLTVSCGDEILARADVAVQSGTGTTVLLLPERETAVSAVWTLEDREKQCRVERTMVWEPVRPLTFYVMISSHTDIGLHNSQYIQRYNSIQFARKAALLADATEERPENDRYRYTMEGTWFWNNYGMDLGREQAEKFAEKYIKTGKIGLCCGVAGNHTQVYGLEEMCRSAYERRRMLDDWGISGETMSMIDNNGMSMALIEPYAEAGYKNIIFAPNQWNPLPSTVWHRDTEKDGFTWNPDAGGGGARVDVRYDSELPMVFFWEHNGKRLLVWCSTQYDHGGAVFGLMPGMKPTADSLTRMENAMAKRLPSFRKKYPYDLWLLACYGDDQEPGLGLTDSIALWNKKWKWPQIRTLGNPDPVFEEMRSRYGDQLPVLTGDITGGWYQHPLTTPELLARKFEADRELPTAEKWSSIAAVLDKTYQYPTEEFRRAWAGLLFNDEHSYGTSGYQGRRVYETWMQHRDWIEKSEKTAVEEKKAALNAIAGKISAAEDSWVLFNQTAQFRQEPVQIGNSVAQTLVPPMGYAVVPVKNLQPLEKRSTMFHKPPIVENNFFRITFTENGSMGSVFDKELNRELLDGKGYGANALLYTADNHVSFSESGKADYQVTTDILGISVTARMLHEASGAEVIQTVTLPSGEKRIEIDNRLNHVRDMFNDNRYYRYAYYAFPFRVDDCRRYCHLNGCVAEYGKSVTGHGTDVYMAVNEWCASENQNFGVALLQLDSELVEFDHIHPDKTDFGNTGSGSQMYVYLANDWLQMHVPGGSALNYRFRFAIISYTGGYRAASIPQMAERFAHKMDVVKIPAQQGILTEREMSFLKIPQGLRLLDMKRPENGDGIIARVYGQGDGEGFCPWKAERVTVDERAMPEGPVDGFATFRLGAGSIRMAERKLNQPIYGSVPAAVGSWYTGLITQPKAARGEHRGHLYLLWGQNMEPDLDHYRLYRSEKPGFEASEETLLTLVYPEEYRVGRYEDTGLKDNTRYYYRVCAVNKAGWAGPISQVFDGLTKE